MVKRNRNRKPGAAIDIDATSLPDDQVAGSSSHTNAFSSGRGRGARGRGGARGGGRGGRGGDRRGAMGASGSSGIPQIAPDPHTTFIIPPPASPTPFTRGRGRGRGGRTPRGGGGGGGGQVPIYVNRGGRGGGGRGRGGGARGGSGGFAGRGRGAGGGTSMGTSMLQDDLNLVTKMFTSQSAPPSTDYANTLYPSLRGPRGAHRGSSSRGAGRGIGGGRGASIPPPVPLPAPTETYRRPSHTAGIGISSTGPKKGYGGYKPVDRNGPLSSLLWSERPLLRPVVFVRSVHSRVLFMEDDDEKEGAESGVKEVEVNDTTVDGDVDMDMETDRQDRKDEAEVEAQMLGGLEDDAGEANLEFATHAPTADRVMRVFSGALTGRPSSHYPSSSSSALFLVGGVTCELFLFPKTSFGRGR